jgi:hypothetical protein
VLTLKRVEVGVTSNNIKIIILDAMATYKGNLSNNDMASKWICLADVMVIWCFTTFGLT